MSKTILVTGGAGYIGSHTVLQLLLSGYKTVVVDNLDNSSDVAPKRVKELAVSAGTFPLTRFDAVIHFAGLNAVGESVSKPLLYHDNNIIGTILLLEVMAAHGCKNLVFSSSAAVYGWPKKVPCTEEFPLSAVNPYRRTKLFIEEICRDLRNSDSQWKIILLRYFNPVGAHPSGHIGEDPRGTPNNLMPFVQQVAVGRRQALTVFGKDYATKDEFVLSMFMNWDMILSSTELLPTTFFVIKLDIVRDYVHVVDLADGHIAALKKLSDPKIGCEVYNLGTGKGTSVLEMVTAFEKASGKFYMHPVVKQLILLNFGFIHRAKYGIEEICEDQWNCASKNPFGYGSPSSKK
ncbi:hypothetical protein GOBAR_DD03429 [Gossypium barbadense]|nr:hypothetical protein GOBAR_DD03429 [Gossypium barbadense]